ncbi:1-deoxy-D-xylulose-5-phosphate reductoisomerase [Porcipelethomonas sp.]|uniref:1-deoxy-D-xylulose-5-phosphate reductoisomerase n=1 Tax=Porcipelethomonas sp. TaxID=2981675 RepID=UPI003EF7F423
MKKTISILGSTGSIGTQAIEVAQKHGIQINALAANRNTKLLAKQCIENNVKTACIFDEGLYQELKELLEGRNIKILTGMDGLCEIAADNTDDMMVNSVVGMVGLLPTLTAIKSGKDIALANKETLVAGGNLVMNLAKQMNVKIYTVDSEHSAIFQCLQGNKRSQLKKILLTASGGPFFGKTAHELKNVTIEQALNHPNWSMGNKITIDSSTLMNKGLEFIEAKWLFDLTPDQIEIIVHRQSVLHSAVEYNDNSVIAQMGVPDMKIPIQYALLYPERMECSCQRLSLTDYGTLTFENPDYETFKCLSACIEAISRGGAYPCIVNGANEEAVGHFLKGKIGFLDIGEIVSQSLDKFGFNEITSYEDVIEFDRAARDFVNSRVL